MYNIREFSKILNVTPQTLRNWDKNGKLKPIRLSERGHRMYDDSHLALLKNEIISEKFRKRKNIIYIRESTKQQLNSLKNQEIKIKEFCVAKGFEIDELYSDIGSALNYKRQNFQKILKHVLNNEIENLIIFYKDRLVRFGFEIFEYFASLNNFNIIIVDNSEKEKTKDLEFAEDLISIIHHFSMKIYGSRNYKKKISLAENNITEISNEIIKNQTL